MDAAAAITGLQSAELAAQVQYAVAAKSLDAAKQQGAAALSLLEAAAELASQVAADSGVGASVNVVA